jgi:hypothetical protein
MIHVTNAHNGGLMSESHSLFDAIIDFLRIQIINSTEVTTKIYRYENTLWLYAASLKVNFTVTNYYDEDDYD